MTASRPILLLGKHGQLGRELHGALGALGPVVALAREDVDVRNSDALRRSIRHHRPRLIVNAAAFTAVDRAESEAELAFEINATAPGIIAAEARNIGVPLIHFSTDYVFDGRARTPYDESAPANPLNVYGRSKLAGEAAIAAAGGSFLIFRLSWLYALHGSNFLRSILGSANDGKPLRVVADQVGCPTWTGAVSAGVCQLLGSHARPAGDFGALGERAGLYHLTGEGQASWHEFASEIVRVFPRPVGEALPVVEAIPTASYPAVAQRPTYSALSSQRARERLGLRLPSWRDQLASAARIACQGQQLPFQGGQSGGATL